MNVFIIAQISTEKILEKLMHIRLHQFLENNNIYNNQYGFRKNSTHALLKITEQIRESIENKKWMWCLYRLKKAFNTVHHDILIQKLEHYGIRNNPLKWFRSYLNRKQYA